MQDRLRCEVYDVSDVKLSREMQTFKCWITRCSEKKVSTIIQTYYEGVGAIVVESLLH